MSKKIYKRNCDYCGKYYEGQGRKFCGRTCYGLAKRGKPTRNPVKRFWEKVKIVDLLDCWTWTAYVDEAGYGHLKHGGEAIAAHRFAYTILAGEIPKGMCVLHRCDNPPCVNPNHLFLGTQIDNIRDMHKKGRYRGGFPKGIPGYGAKLKPADIIEIRLRISAGIPQSAIAEEFGVAQTNISHINTGKTWTCIK